MRRRHFFVPLLAACVASFTSIAPAHGEDTYAIGWIGALTGPAAKYGASAAAQLAVEDVNANGGILGRKLRLIQEDAQCKGPLAISALRKLVSGNGVRFIIGGHCSPESIAIAPLVDSLGVLSLAAITTSPKFTGISKYALRVSPQSVVLGDLLARYARGKRYERVGIVAEETDYVLPVAERFSFEFIQLGGKVRYSLNFTTGESDFRAFAAKLRDGSLDAVYVGAQSPDSARLIVQQLRQHGVTIPLLGNEQVGHVALTDSGTKEAFSGVVFGEPEFDASAPASAAFVKRYEQRTGVKGLPLGVFTVEAYDAVRLLAESINSCGEKREQVRECLLGRTYSGASGTFTIDQNGDGVRRYVLKQLSAEGEPQTLPAQEGESTSASPPA